MGEYDLTVDDEEFPYIERRVRSIELHPDFDAHTFQHDLALLRFRNPVRFRENIIPICLPEGDSSFVGEAAHVTGWGRLHESKYSIN